MNEQLFRLIYCSRNRIPGSAADVTKEIHNILHSARANNAALAVTGALLYNAGNFAQVLEGPLEAVGKIFEKIQRDLRHSEVIVIESGLTGERQFADWSMAFSGSALLAPKQSAKDAFDAAFSRTVGAGEQLLSVLRELVQQEDDWALIDAA